jgi:deferrochelatase/peroxidase EfeB
LILPRHFFPSLRAMLCRLSLSRTRPVKCNREDVIFMLTIQAQAPEMIVSPLTSVYQTLKWMRRQITHPPNMVSLSHHLAVYSVGLNLWKTKGRLSVSSSALSSPRSVTFNSVLNFPMASVKALICCFSRFMFGSTNTDKKSTGRP